MIIETFRFFMIRVIQMILIKAIIIPVTTKDNYNLSSKTL